MLQVREKFPNLLPLPTFPLEFPQEWGENPNSELIFENSLAGISHSSQTRFSVKKHFSHTEKQGLWGQNIPKCWHKTVPHALIPCTKSHFICIYRPTAFEQDSSNGHLLQMVKEAEFCLITIRKIISWGLALHLSGCEGCRRRKNPPSLSDPRQGLPRRGWESRKYSQSKCVSLSHWAKNKYKTHKWHRSSWRAEILFAKFQPGVIFSFFFFFFPADFHKPQTGGGFTLEMLTWFLLVTSPPQLYLVKLHQKLVVMGNLKRFKGYSSSESSPRSLANTLRRAGSPRGCKVGKEASSGLSWNPEQVNILKALQNSSTHYKNRASTFSRVAAIWRFAQYSISISGPF